MKSPPMEFNSTLRGLLRSVMTDVSGKVRLESEDPRWGQLFRKQHLLLMLQEHVEIMPWFIHRMIENNPTTGNLLQLLEQTIQRLKTISNKKVPPSSYASEQCSSSLYMCGLIFHYFSSKLDPNEIRFQLNLNPLWPSVFNADHSVPGGYTGELLMEQLISEAIAALSVECDKDWMEETQFFCVDLLVCLCSGQLYCEDKSINAGNDSVKLFQEHLFIMADKEFRECMSSPITNSVSQTLAAKLVKSLLRIGLEASGIVGIKNGFENKSINKRNVLLYSLVQQCENHYLQQNGFALQLNESSEIANNRITRTHQALTWNLIDIRRRENLEQIKKLVFGLLLLFSFQTVHKFFSKLTLRTDKNFSTHPMVLKENLSSQNGSEISRDGSNAPQMNGGHDEFSMNFPATFTQEDTWENVVNSIPPDLQIIERNRFPSDPLKGRSTSLLLVLLFTRKNANSNPFREAFCLLHDESIIKEDKVHIKPVVDSRNEVTGVDRSNANGILEMSWISKQQERSSMHMNNHSRNASALMDDWDLSSNNESSFSNSTHSSIFVEFQIILNGFESSLFKGDTVILLYAFLHTHPTFIASISKTPGTLSFINTSGIPDEEGPDSIGKIILPLLNRLYDTTAPLQKMDSNTMKHGKNVIDRENSSISSTSSKQRSYSDSVIQSPMQLKAKINIKHGESHETNHLYMIVVCILIIVQDSSMLQTLQNRKCGRIVWYKERLLSNEATYLDLLILCILRTALHAIFRLRDDYLLMNCMAIFSNIAKPLHGLHHYTAERVVKVAKQLCNRYIKRFNDSIDLKFSIIAEEVGRFNHGAIPISSTTKGYSTNQIKKDRVDKMENFHRDNNSNPVDEDGSSSEDKENQINHLIEEMLTGLLKFIVLALRQESRLSNVNMLYALMNEYDAIVQQFSHPIVTNLFQKKDDVSSSSTTNGSTLPIPIPLYIINTTAYYLHMVEESLQEGNPNKYVKIEEVVSFLKDKVIQTENIASLSLNQDLDAPFCYQEGENAQEFFMPFIWSSLIQQSPEIPWQFQNITLLDPITEGLLKVAVI